MPILDSLIQTLGAIGTLMAAVVIVSVSFTVAYMLWAWRNTAVGD